MASTSTTSAAPITSGPTVEAGQPAGTTPSDVVLDIPSFMCMVESRVSFVFANHTSHSDVMSVKVTSQLFTARDERKPIKSASGMPLKRLQLPGPRPLPIHPGFNAARLNKQLIRERDAFMARLRREREERHIRENLAAVRIQAVWRGQQVRPKPKRARRKPKSRPSEDWREELRALTLATEEAINGPMEGASDWRRSVNKKANAKRNRKLRRAAEYTAASNITAVVRGFLARRAFALVWRHHMRRVRADAVVHIQAMFRGFALRRSLDVEAGAKRQRAAIRIQCLVRGTQARTRCRWLMCAMRQAQEAAAAATQIQCAFRTTAARRRVQLRRETKAATAMQSSVRGFAARRSVRARTRARRDAATRIQSVGRGYIARSTYGGPLAEARARRQEAAAAVRIQSVTRARTGRRKAEARRAELAAARAKREAEEAAAAAKMQSAVRGRLARGRVGRMREEKQQTAAATKIQSIRRGRAARKKVAAKRQRLREDKAVKDVQRLARGRVARKRVARMKDQREKAQQAKAATRIAAAARGRKARKQVRVVLCVCVVCVVCVL